MSAEFAKSVVKDNLQNSQCIDLLLYTKKIMFYSQQMAHWTKFYVWPDVNFVNWINPGHAE